MEVNNPDTYIGETENIGCTDLELNARMCELRWYELSRHMVGSESWEESELAVEREGDC
jgi:hypothetical protein